MTLWQLPRAARPDAPLAVTSVARSHVGRVRRINEDRVFNCAEARLWAVADGMGGHGGGDLAAQAVVDALRAAACGDFRQMTVATMLDALQTANRAVMLSNELRSEEAGATVVALHLEGAMATLAWAGDSRAYLLRDGLRQLTHDHSVVQELVDAGLLTPNAAQQHPRANVVTRALGVGREVDLAITSVEIKRGDRILLCSDGLSRSLDASTICAKELECLADSLLDNALCRDGGDNISFILIDVHKLQPT